MSRVVVACLSFLYLFNNNINIDTIKHLSVPPVVAVAVPTGALVTTDTDSQFFLFKKAPPEILDTHRPAAMLGLSGGGGEGGGGGGLCRLLRTAIVNHIMALTAAMDIATRRFWPPSGLTSNAGEAS